MTGTMTMPPPMPIKPASSPAPAPDANPRQTSHNPLIAASPASDQVGATGLEHDPGGDVVPRYIQDGGQPPGGTVGQRGDHDADQQADRRYEQLFHDLSPKKRCQRSQPTRDCPSGRHRRPVTLFTKRKKISLPDPRLAEQPAAAHPRLSASTATGSTGSRRKARS